MALNPPHEKEQLKAIEIQLATAPKIQEDLKAKFGYGENIFFYNDLVEYRINNSALDIAEDLDLEERYDLINDQPRKSVGCAFRGHHDEDFMPDYRFDGLLGKITNDIIEGQRKSKGGLKIYELGIGIHAQTPEERSENGRKSYANSLANLTPEERSEHGRKGGLMGGRARALAQGQHVWSLEEIVDIANFREESIGKGRYKTLPCWNDTTSKMNEKYDKDWTTSKIMNAYHYNKDLIADEEE